MSAYRSAERVDGAVRAVACASCGAVARTGTDETFRCARCHREQPVLREDLAPRLERCAAKHWETSRYAALSEFCEAVGAMPSCVQVTLDCDGIDCTVTLSLDSGTPRGVDLMASAEDFPELHLVREGIAERDAKETGVSREVQMGDVEFDAAVYVKSDAADEDVRTVLGPKAVRAALVQLLQHYTDVRFSETGVSATGNTDAPRCFQAKSLMRDLAALRVVAGAPRALVPKEVPRRRPGAVVTSAINWLSVGVGVAAMATSLHFYTPVAAFGIVMSGVVLGVVVAFASGPLFVRVFRGRSRSHEDLAFARLASFLGFPMLCVTALVLSNGALDRGAERVDELRVIGATYDDQEHELQVTAKGPPDIGTTDLSFHLPKGAAKVGDVVRFWTRPGLLGVRWTTRDAEIVTHVPPAK